MLSEDFARICYKYQLAGRYARKRDIERLSRVSCDIADFWDRRPMSEVELEIVDGFEKRIDGHVRDWIDEETLDIWEYALGGGRGDCFEGYELFGKCLQIER
ncbi:hypothetical protein HNV12_02690 [Methanococcoides sp. SA1]|nr:hypothetical protein [Methanococcoides sp. SA1]